MRPAPILLALLVGVLSAAPRVGSAQVCTDGIAKKLSLSPGREHLRFTGTFVPPTTLDPLASGLSIAIGYEPVGTPGNVFFPATIPSELFVQVRQYVRYRDFAATLAGIKQVVFSSRKGVAKVKINRRGAALAGSPRDGLVSITLGSGASCVRACIQCVGSPRFKCFPTGDAGTCG